MDKQTMYELLEIYDAVQKLYVVDELLTGIQHEAGYGEGILGNLSYVSDIIKRHSPLYRPGEDLEKSEFWQLLENQKIDNRKKAEILLGMQGS